MVNFQGHPEVSKTMIEVSHSFSPICTMNIVTEGLSPFLSLSRNTVVFVCEVFSTHTLTQIQFACKSQEVFCILCTWSMLK